MVSPATLFLRDVLTPVLGQIQSVPEIKVSIHAKMICEMYGKNLEIQFNQEDTRPLSGSYNLAAASAHLTSDLHPIMQLHVVELMDIHQRITKAHSRNASDVFASTVFVYFTHELLHLALRQIPPFAKMLPAEEMVWAHTCEQIIGPLIVQGRPPSNFPVQIYETWAACGKERNEKWSEFIKNTYTKSNRH